MAKMAPNIEEGDELRRVLGGGQPLMRAPSNHECAEQIGVAK